MKKWWRSFFLFLLSLDYRHIFKELVHLRTQIKELFLQEEIQNLNLRSNLLKDDEEGSWSLEVLLTVNTLKFSFSSPKYSQSSVNNISGQEIIVLSLSSCFFLHFNWVYFRKRISCRSLIFYIKSSFSMVFAYFLERRLGISLLEVHFAHCSRF